MSSSERGFTLVEVLVALVIFSTAILGLMRAGTQNIQAVHVAEQKQVAGMIADNQLILALHSETPLRVGSRQGNVEMASWHWNWILQTETTTQAGFYKLTMTISEKDSEQTILTRIAYTHSPIQAKP